MRSALVSLVVLMMFGTAMLAVGSTDARPQSVSLVDLGVDESRSAPVTRSAPRDEVLQRSSLPLAGRVVVVDPGHQLGNREFPRQVNRLVPAGGFRKPCNTTGTATSRGYPEATFVWRVSRLLQSRLEALGARVVLTRTSNRDDRWGPCVDERGRRGNRIGADLKLSVHADGSLASGRGFHVIAPSRREGWTDDIARPSRRLAVAVRAGLRSVGLPVSTYAGERGLDVRSDLATLNLADVPSVMVELGNMRNAVDARRMTSPRGRAAYVRGLGRAVVRYLR
jgi:N-acetylmuramoyl-L-alanine amidase